jgi:hypothetical protein
MKRVNNRYHRISTYENLCLAFWKAAKGKQDRQEVIAFRKDFDANIRRLQQQVIRHKPDIGHYRFFRVFDPKQRSICAASFPERVLHHAIMNVCEPLLDAYAISDSYACRKGKGNRKALERARNYCRIFPWYLKLDVQKYFDSIDHSIVIEKLARHFKDDDLLELFGKLLDTYHTKPGKGLPIGNLISQHLANFYLGIYDHWIKEKRRLRGYLRYMDDFILFGPNKALLKTELAETRKFLARELALDLKENIQLNRCIRGIPFLGYRIFPQTIRLVPRSRKRFIQKFKLYEEKWHKGEWSVNDLARHMEPLIEFTRAADSIGLRRNVIQRFGVSVGIPFPVQPGRKTNALSGLVAGLDDPAKVPVWFHLLVYYSQQNYFW